MTERKGVLILIFLFVLMSTASALTLTGTIVDQKVPIGQTFTSNLIIESEEEIEVFLELNGTGFSIDKNELTISPYTKETVTIKGTSPAQGYIRVTAFPRETTGNIRTGLSGFVKICVNAECPILPTPTRKPTPAPTPAPEETPETPETPPATETTTPPPAPPATGGLFILAIVIVLTLALAFIAYRRRER